MDETAGLQAILKEVEGARAAMERSYGAIYTSFGVVLPALAGIFVFLARERVAAGSDESWYGALFIVILSLGAMWSQNLWMELLRYARYYYVELLPRLYAASGQGGRRNFLEWSGRRSLRSWLPILLFNLGCIAVLVAVGCKYLAAASRWVQVGSGALVLAACCSVVAVLIEARKVEEEILARALRESGDAAG
jgi:hypothetical protein